MISTLTQITAVVALMIFVNAVDAASERRAPLCPSQTAMTDSSAIGWYFGALSRPFNRV